MHYRNLPNFRKRIVCSEIAKLPVRAFVLASNKKNMRRYRNLRAERVRSQQWFYNYCLRLLLERVTHFCYEHAKSERADDRLLKIIYSERGGHSYGQTIAYQEFLKNQAKGRTLVLTKRRIMWEVLDWRLAEPASHKSSAGAQLPTSSQVRFTRPWIRFRQLSGTTNTPNCCSLSYQRRTDFTFNYGLSLQPTPSWKAKLTDQQKESFEFYGYGFWP